MEMTAYKKPLGICFLVLLGIFALNMVISLVPISSEPLLNSFRAYFTASHIAQIAVVAYLAFSNRCKSNVIVKVGASLYILLMLLAFVNNIGLIVTSHQILYIEGVSGYVNSLVLYAPGLLLLVWGSKLWSPIKISSSVLVAFDVIENLIWLKLRPMYQNFDEYGFEQIEPIQKLGEYVGYLYMASIVCTIIFVILWLVQKPKDPTTPKQQIDLI